MSASKQLCGLNWATLSAATPEPSSRRCYDPTGVAITLKAKDEKASGGEGVVYTVPGKPGILVKVYKHETLDNPSKAQALLRRIEAMCAKDRCRNMQGLAWPLMPVYGDAVHRKLIGFAMQACRGVPFTALFAGPASVKAKFPAWNRSQLARTAVNFVRRVRELSEDGVLVNDFNPANFWVDAHCNVSFIDADSFQVADKCGCPMITHTFFASHAAPELLADPSALSRPRTIEQVAFSTALVAFQLLMCGYHPYSYQGVRNGSGCGSPDENLLAGRCPLGIGAECRLPEGWYRLWSYLTGKLKNAFITTFRDGHSAPSMRTPLESLEFELNGLLCTMNKDPDPDRVSLNPTKVKPREWIKNVRPTYPSYGLPPQPPYSFQPFSPHPSRIQPRPLYNPGAHNPNTRFTANFGRKRGYYGQGVAFAAGQY